jgi:hypothetical protein
MQVIFKFLLELTYSIDMAHSFVPYNQFTVQTQGYFVENKFVITYDWWVVIALCFQMSSNWNLSSLTLSSPQSQKEVLT